MTVKFVSMEDVLKHVEDMVDSVSGGYAAKYDLTRVAQSLTTTVAGGYELADREKDVIDAMERNRLRALAGVLNVEDGEGEVEINGWNGEFIEEVPFNVGADGVKASVTRALGLAGYQVAGGSGDNLELRPIL